MGLRKKSLKSKSQMLKLDSDSDDLKTLLFSSFKIYLQDEFSIGTEVLVQVKLDNRIIEVSPPVSTYIEKNFEEDDDNNPEINIENWEFTYVIDGVSYDDIDLLMSNPFIFHLIENKQIKCLGTCCLDLISILLSNTVDKFHQSLILFSDELEYGKELPRWPKLPKLMLSIEIINGPLIDFDIIETSNIVYMTLESLYYPPEELVNTPDLKYKAATQIPMKNEKLDKVFFGYGKISMDEDLECKKKWLGCSNDDGRYAYSSYKLFTQNSLHRLGLDVESLQGKATPRIEWNALSRHFLYGSAVNEFRFLLDRSKSWPLELYFSPEIQTKIQQKNKNNNDDENNNINFHYICFLDLKGLLNPGETRIRVASQLYTYCQEDILQQCFAEQSLLKKQDDDLTETETVPSKILKQKKISIKKPNEDEASDLFSPLGGNEYFTRPVFNESRNPCFIIFEIELMKPLIPKRSMKEILDMLRMKFPRGEEMPKVVECAQLARQNFEKALTSAVQKINSEYSNYIKSNFEENSKKCELKNGHAENFSENYDSNKEKEIEHHDHFEKFLEYSKKSGTYSILKSTLGSSIHTLVKDVFIFKNIDNDPVHKNHEHINQDYISNIYTHLIDDMHEVVNSMITKQEEEVNIQLEAKEYSRFTYEAEHFNDIKSAERFQLQRVQLNKMDPNVWIDLASFWLRIGVKDTRPEECVKEALALNNRNVKGLVMYGLILTKRRQYPEAKKILESATMLNPKMPEVWFALYLHAELVDDLPTADWALINARNYFQTIEREFWPSSWGQPLEWSSTYYDAQDIYYSSFLCLMELSLYEFAECAAAKYLSHCGKSALLYNYMMSVIDLCKKRYKASLFHIKQALPGRALDPPLHLIAGLCYYKLGQIDLMKIQFEYLDKLEWNREKDLRDQENIKHLVHVHLGMAYVNENDYMKAKAQLRSGARRTPSPRIFLALGIVNYKLGYNMKAEEAFITANFLDNYNPEIWGYLAIINIHKSCKPAFEQCYRQMIKNGLDNQALFEEIELLKEWCHFSDPEIIEKPILCICETDKSAETKTREHASVN